MTRWLTGALLFCASLVAAACPLCIGAYRQSPAQELRSCGRRCWQSRPLTEQLPSRRGDQGRAATERHDRGRLFQADAAAREAQSRCCSCATPHGRCGSTLARSAPSTHAGCASSPQESAGRTCTRRSGEPASPSCCLISKIPSRWSPRSRTAIRKRAVRGAAALKSRLDAAKLRRWIDDPRSRTPSTYTLLLGIVGDEKDAARYEHGSMRRGKAGTRPTSAHARRRPGVARSLADDLDRRQVYPRSPGRRRSSKRRCSRSRCRATRTKRSRASG